MVYGIAWLIWSLNGGSPASTMPAASAHHTGCHARSDAPPAGSDIPQVLSLPMDSRSSRRPQGHRHGQIQPTPLDQDRHPDCRWGGVDNVELAYLHSDASLHNWVNPQFYAHGYSTLDHSNYKALAEQGSMIHSHIIWRSGNTHVRRPGEPVRRALVANRARIPNYARPALRISGGLGPPFRVPVMAPSSDASARKVPVIARD